MNLVRANPWSLFDQLNRELTKPLVAFEKDENGDVATPGWSPSVDITENDDNFTLLADIPGVDPKAIEVSMDKSILTVKGERKTEEKAEKGNYRRVERHYGLFYRRFTLPDSANADKIEARSENGVLKVTIPKKEVAQARRITIKH